MARRRSKQDWSPRGASWAEAIETIIRDLQGSGSSEGHAIGDALADMNGNGDLTDEEANSILDEFEEWALGMRSLILKHLRAPWGENISRVIRDLLSPGIPAASAIGELLQGVHEQGDLTEDLALSILDEFEGWAVGTRSQVEDIP